MGLGFRAPGYALQITAHRGIPEVFPENTLPSFRAAAALPVFAVEFDVHLTRDGIPVVTHDDTIERCSNGTGRVGEHTFAELRQLDFGAWKGPEFFETRIPTLDETVRTILETAPSRRMLMEVKEEDLDCAAVVLDYVRGEGIVEQTMLTSFSPRVLRFLRDRGGDDVMLHGSDRGDGSGIAEFRFLLNSVGIHHKGITPDAVGFCHRLGIRVDAWVLNNVADIRRVCECGVDGITTNAAARIIRELAKTEGGKI